jgi:hypothetical protein
MFGGIIWRYHLPRLATAWCCTLRLYQNVATHVVKKIGVKARWRGLPRIKFSSDLNSGSDKCVLNCIGVTTTNDMTLKGFIYVEPFIYAEPLSKLKSELIVLQHQKLWAYQSFQPSAESSSRWMMSPRTCEALRMSERILSQIAGKWYLPVYEGEGNCSG